MPADPFHIENPPSVAGRAVMAAARPLLSWLLALPACRELYELTKTRCTGPFERRALDALDIQVLAPDAGLRTVPSSGPLLVASNHPHGALDGLVLAAILRSARADVRILANRFLSRIPELAGLCCFVDPFGRSAATV